MCQMVTNGFNSLGTGFCNFISGGWEQATIIAALSKQILFLNRSGVSENFSSLNLPGKVAAVVLGLAVASAAISVFRKGYDQAASNKPSTL